MLGRDSSAISPTAHYTGEIWRRNGLSDPALGTWQGRLLHGAVEPLMLLSRGLGGETLEDFLVARHRIIDSVLEQAIAASEVGQVVEIAAGMSPRGLRFTRRHPDLIYIETDLSAMAARKREALDRAGAQHRVVELDAMLESGPGSLAELAGGLDRGRGLAVISEGLLNYFPRGADLDLFSRIRAALGRFPRGLYLADVVLSDRGSGALGRAFGSVLGAFVRGRIHLPFRDRADAIAGLERAGFERAVVHRGSEGGAARGADRVAVIEARSD